MSLNVGHGVDFTPRSELHCTGRHATWGALSSDQVVAVRTVTGLAALVVAGVVVPPGDGLRLRFGVLVRFGLRVLHRWCWAGAGVAVCGVTIKYRNCSFRIVFGIGFEVKSARGKNIAHY